MDLTVLIWRREAEAPLSAGEGAECSSQPGWGHFHLNHQLRAHSKSHSAKPQAFAGCTVIKTFYKSDFCCHARAQRAIHLRRITKIHLQHSICYQPSPSSALQHNKSHTVPPSCSIKLLSNVQNIRISLFNTEVVLKRASFLQARRPAGDTLNLDSMDTLILC